MRRLLRYLVLFIAVSTGAAQAEPHKLLVEKVEDGDTLVVMHEGKTLRLQLKGIDAPEDVDNAKLQRDIKTTGLEAEALLKLGRSATRHLEILAPKGQFIGVEGALDKPDRYGRIPVMVFDRVGRSLNDAMVAGGYATVLRYGKPDEALKSRLERLEAEAIKARRGLWGKQREAAMAWSGHADRG